jgi:hypothetical protein
MTRPITITNYGLLMQTTLIVELQIFGWKKLNVMN